jgi:hypothetical protein
MPRETGCKGSITKLSTAWLIPMSVAEKFMDLLTKAFKTGEGGVPQACDLPSTCQLPSAATIKDIEAQAKDDGVSIEKSEKTVKRVYDCCKPKRDADKPIISIDGKRHET